MTAHGSEKLRWLVRGALAVMRVKEKTRSPDALVSVNGTDEDGLSRSELTARIRHDLFRETDDAVFDVLEDRELRWHAMAVDPDTPRVRAEACIVHLMSVFNSYLRWLIKQCFSHSADASKWMVVTESETEWHSDLKIAEVMLLPERVEDSISHIESVKLGLLLRECFCNFDLPIEKMGGYARHVECGWAVHDAVVHNEGNLSDSAPRYCRMYRSRVGRRVDLQSTNFKRLVGSVISFAALLERYLVDTGRVNI
jgi:hypothetical protein